MQRPSGAIVAAILMCVVGHAEAQDALDDKILFGINRTSGQLWRYNFDSGEVKTIGTVRNTANVTLVGIDGSAYIPGHQNIIGFWVDPADNQSKVVYINCETAQAAQVGQALGPGKVTGAVTALAPKAGKSLSGSININPNNSPHNEFTLTKIDGHAITRDDLHQNTDVDQYGVYYQGDATGILVKPKGNGNQNSLSVGGSSYSLQNSSTYLITGPLTVTLRNDHIHNSKAMGHWWADISATSATIEVLGGDEVALETQWTLFAVQQLEAQEGDTIDFEIENDSIVPSEPFAAKVSVLGAAISYGGQYDMPVTTKFRLAGQVFTPFGSFGQALDGNVNDSQNPREHIFPNLFDAGTPIDVIGRAWKKKKSWYSGSKESHWKTHRTIDGSDSGSPYVIVLKDGDDVPDIEGFLDQGSIVDFVVDYIDQETNKVTLDENQAIILFELGVTNLNSPAADFQDQVVLVTLAASPDELLETNSPPQDDDEKSASRLLRVDHRTGGFVQLMTLDRDYDGLAATDGQRFYGSSDGALYLIDPSQQTETLVGSLGDDDVFGLDFAGASLMGFKLENDRLMQIDAESGAVTGSFLDVGMTDLGTIIFMAQDQDPAKKPKSYD